MPVIVWDEVGSRVYENGLDKGVLYLPNGSAVPWNGLTSVIEQFDKETSPVYYDGMKINDLVILGDFAATMKAVSYPDKFLELEGTAPLRPGLFIGDQPPQVFCLCYRTQVGNDLAGDTIGYKIHILYNVTAIPNEKTYASISGDPSLVEFEWNLVAVPEEVPGYRPTAHIIINSLELDPWLLEELEEILYGSSSALASLIPMSDLITKVTDWYRIKITDNGDGTWTATSTREELIDLNENEGMFTIYQANAIYLDSVTYSISDTIDLSDIPEIKIIDNGDGTWTAVTEHDSLFSVDANRYFEILNANAIFVDSETYRVSDTEQ